MCETCKNVKQTCSGRDSGRGSRCVVGCVARGVSALGQQKAPENFKIAVRHSGIWSPPGGSPLAPGIQRTLDCFHFGLLSCTKTCSVKFGK